MYGNVGNYGKGGYRRDSVSPPLHHPVPQHPIPPMRSPSNLEETFSAQKHQKAPSNPYIPQQQLNHQALPRGNLTQDSHAALNSINATSDYGSQPDPSQQQGGAFGQYSNLFTDPSAQLGINVSRNALSYGQDYVARHVGAMIH